MKKSSLKILSLVVFIGVLTGCQGPQRQQGYVSCLDVSMLGYLSSEKNVEMAADKSIENCEPLLDEYTKNLATDYMRSKGWNRLNPSAYTIFKKDAVADVRKKLIENYGE